MKKLKSTLTKNVLYFLFKISWTFRVLRELKKVVEKRLENGLIRVIKWGAEKSKNAAKTKKEKKIKNVEAAK